MSVLLPLLMGGLLLTGGAWWLNNGLPGLIALTHQAIILCRSLFVRCMGDIHLIKLILIWSSALLIAAGVLYAAITALIGIAKARSAIKRLPQKKSGAVSLILDPNPIAFTHGLLRPRIYISTGMINGLEREELKAVFLHELHHKQSFDPLRYFALKFFRDAFFYVPAVKCVVNRIKVKRENEADDAAMKTIGTPLPLASALLKATAFNTAVCHSVSISGASVGERVERLITGKDNAASRRPIKTVAASAAVAAFLLLTLSIPLEASSNAKQDCTESRCATHVDRLGDSCRTHCKTMEHKH
ncbi:MAG: M56 family metallopeptidase [Deltaproteobacteria bacterium]|nr:M56 family metallopeptidase [Deltaproteobacteria bacterium]